MTNETAERIERHVERDFDRLDKRLMRGELGQEDYDAQARAIDAWACAQYAKAHGLS